MCYKKEKMMETIKLEFPDGIVECNILGSFQLREKDYIALVPSQDGDDVFLYGYVEKGEEIELRNLSEEEFTLAAQEFQRILEESEK
ncbi:MAG: DUF1292 domain-containing protein [Oscillospiraceae bacterium]|nr:DUF1292 domain-containing protein [Oscillospiraceae bacterium]